MTTRLSERGASPPSVDSEPDTNFKKKKKNYTSQHAPLPDAACLRNGQVPGCDCD